MTNGKIIRRLYELDTAQVSHHHHHFCYLIALSSHWLETIQPVDKLHCMSIYYGHYRKLTPPKVLLSLDEQLPHMHPHPLCMRIKMTNH